MPKFKNISTGDRGLYTVEGLIMVPAGATTEDVDLAKDEVPNEEWFEKSTAKPQLDHDKDGKAGGAAPAKD